MLSTLKDRDWPPAQHALDALVVLYQLEEYRRLDRLLPGCQWHLLATEEMMRHPPANFSRTSSAGTCPAPGRGWMSDRPRSVDDEQVAAGRDAGLAVSLRLELGRAESLRAVVQLRSLADPTVLADAADVWSGWAMVPELSGSRAQVDTLLTLRRDARAWPPAGRLLDTAAPDGLDLSDEEAQALLGEAAERLSAAGVAVHWPKELVRELTADGVLEPARRKGTQSAAESFLSSGGLLNSAGRSRSETRNSPRRNLSASSRCTGRSSGFVTSGWP